jgi:2-(1,2-epoxy-1,2-dihydrophenyl)acetyl-CoA isomerase
MPNRVSGEIKDGIATIVLNRPEKGNAVDPEFAHELSEVIRSVAENAFVRAVLLTGTGKSFCLGGDIVGMCAAPDLRSHLASMIDTLHQSILTLSALRVPMVTAINGPLGGGGIGLALCADIILGSESMKLRGGYSAIGLTPDLGTSWRLARCVGVERAREILFLNRTYDAQQCLEWGLVNAIYPKEQLAREARDLVEGLAAAATLSLGCIKSAFDGIENRTFQQQLELERECMLDSASTEDAREGLNAFLQKRKPKFVGR